MLQQERERIEGQLSSKLEESEQRNEELQATLDSIKATLEAKVSESGLLNS